MGESQVGLCLMSDGFGTVGTDDVLADGVYKPRSAGEGGSSENSRSASASEASSGSKEDGVATTPDPESQLSTEGVVQCIMRSYTSCVGNEGEGFENRIAPKLRALRELSSCLPHFMGFACFERGCSQFIVLDALSRVALRCLAEHDDDHCASACNKGEVRACSLEGVGITGVVTGAEHLLGFIPGERDRSDARSFLGKVVPPSARLEESSITVSKSSEDGMACIKCGFYPDPGSKDGSEFGNIVIIVPR